MKILCYRHPKPLGGDQVCYGQTDLDIDDLELDQLKKKLRPIVFQDETILYTSPLKRCLKVADSLGCPYLIEPALQEISFGIYDGLAWDDIPREDLDLWAKDIEDYHFPRGESYKNLKGRVEHFIKVLKEKKIGKGQYFLFLTHAGVMRALMDLIEGKPIFETLKIPLPYGDSREFYLA